MSISAKRPVVMRWVSAFTALMLLTIAMLVFRGRLDKVHVALLYLLVVLGGSSVAGRRLGVTLGGAAFLLFNFFFLPPYYKLTIADPLDWLVLVTFLVTSIVAAELFHRQRQQAALAETRRAELDQLATLGAETLNAARAEQALGAIAEVIRKTVGVERCELFVLAGGLSTDRHELDLRLIADASGTETAEAGSPERTGLLRYIVDTGRVAVGREDGTMHVLTDDDGAGAAAALERMRAFAMPLIARGQTVGALRVSGARAFSLTADQRRILGALAYYAALGIERFRSEGAEEAAEALRRADHLKDALLAAVSHDLRTPLTTIKGIAHEIVQGADRSRAADIEGEADRLAAMVESLLELSQLNAGAFPLTIELNTVDDLAGAALRRAETLLRSHPVEVDFAGDDLMVGRFDFVHSLRILVNLLENAAKYSAADAPIVISASRGASVIAIAVSDRGGGIPPADFELIFEPFYRVAGATPDVRGAGLGLSIARRLARAQHGELTVAPRDGGGSTFTLHLPAGDLPQS